MYLNINDVSHFQMSAVAIACVYVGVVGSDMVWQFCSCSTSSTCACPLRLSIIHAAHWSLYVLTYRMFGLHLYTLIFPYRDGVLGHLWNRETPATWDVSMAAQPACGVPYL